MEFFEMDSLFLEIVSLYMINLIVISFLCKKLNFLFILVWPIAIYSIGPYISYAYLYAPVLSRYIFPENFLEESALFSVFLLLLVALDYFFDIGVSIRKYIFSKEVTKIGASKLMLVLFYLSGFACAIFQIALMVQYGSIFSGSYLSLTASDGSSDDQAISWGMLGGLYEVFFSCTVVIFISKKNKPILSKDMIFYSFVLFLRLLGGTRLILVKELSILLFILIVQKRVRPLFVVFAALAMIFLGTVVGFARSNGAAQGFGPLSSLAYESSLNALTLNIAENLAHDPSSLQYYNPGDVLLNLSASIIPSFIRHVFVKDESGVEINMATQAGFDTASPVGSMQLFASSIYIFFYPWVGPILFPVFLLFLAKVNFNKRFKAYLLISVFIESLNLWRDPLDVSLKVVVQTVVIYYVVGMDWRRVYNHISRLELPPRMRSVS